MNQVLRQDKPETAALGEKEGRALLKDIRRWMPLLAALLLTPFTAVWLMQLAYGAAPWAMPLPVAAANALCIALLYWPLCGLTGRVWLSSWVFHLAAGLWGAANYFVNLFRGTPILPWDFSALGTAADVAGSYRFVPTWRVRW